MAQPLENQADFPRMEHEILTKWQESGAFEHSVCMHDDEVVFYDGPPFATGSPHHGTVLVSVLKDSLARFLTMNGKSVPRRWGWDCHGLPIENAIERDLGISEKGEIETYGVAEFNSRCRELVMGYNESWRTYIDKIGRWVDYDHPYRTLDRDFMESVIWAFKESYNKELIYRDYRVTPYCYRCETSLSLSDTRESDSTRPRVDHTMTVAFRLREEDADGLFGAGNVPAGGAYLAAWTTTPWTLPGNLALGVSTSLTYEFYLQNDKLIGIAQEVSRDIAETLGLAEKSAYVVNGANLAGLRYTPLLEVESVPENAFQVLAADFVNADEGTGIVHLAPAFGEDDYWTCRGHGIGLVNHVDSKGYVNSLMPEMAGFHVHHDEEAVARIVRGTGSVLAESDYEHNYPHCWRCNTPLIYRAMDAWYFSIEKIKDRLIEKNKEINWIPKSVSAGRFGKWLEGSRDWNISRNRYWGTPLPVWECEGCSNRWVAGSAEELESYAGHPLPDLHMEFLDPIEVPCSCGGVMRRVPEVLDCWFESGAMPFAQCHYPFENRDWFTRHFPADFIIEYPGQIRCWFYYLHVLSVALMDKPAFKNCLVHGTIQAEDGTKLSKSRKNYTDPLLLIDKHGADGFRLYMMDSPAAVMGDLRFVDTGPSDKVKGILLPLWNAYKFFRTYADIDGYRGYPNTEFIPTQMADRWITSEMSHAVTLVTDAYQNYQLDGVVQPITDLIESLNKWYIRRNRRRFWSEGTSEDKTAAFDTLFNALVCISKLLAPAAPFFSDWLYGELLNDGSVHHSAWPEAMAVDSDELRNNVDTARRIVALGLSLRKKSDLRVRQPLRAMSIVLPETTDSSALDDQLEDMAEELNVKEIKFVDDYNEFAVIRAVPNARVLGPKLGREMQDLIQAAKEGNVVETDEGYRVSSNTNEWIVSRDDLAIGYQAKEGYDVAGDHGIVVAIDTTIDDDLREEGLANDLNRVVQNMRKEAGYHVSDRILLHIDGPLNEIYRQRVAQSALAELCHVEHADAETAVTIGGSEYSIRMRRSG